MMMGDTTASQPPTDDESALPSNQRAPRHRASYVREEYSTPPERRKRALLLKQKRAAWLEEDQSARQSAAGDLDADRETPPDNPAFGRSRASRDAWELVGQKLLTPELDGRLPRSILHHSQMSLPEVANLAAKLNERAPAARGPKANSALPVAALLRVGISSSPAEYQASYDTLFHGSDAVRWPWNAPGEGPCVSQARKTIAGICRRVDSEELVNDALGQAIRRCLRSGLLTDNFGTAFYVDGTLIPANVEQVAQPEEARQLAWGAYYGHIGARLYDKPYRFVVGYNAVVLTEATTGLPCAYKILRADETERDGLIALVPELFRRVPELKQRWKIVSGDGHYDQSPEMNERLLQDFGLHVIAPLIDQHRKGKPLLDTEGIPPCPEGHGLMELRNVEGEPELSGREDDGRLPSDVTAAEIVVRWRCDQPHCRETQRTFPIMDPRLHSAYPREVQSARGNIVSSCVGDATSLSRQ